MQLWLCGGCSCLCTTVRHLCIECWQNCCPLPPKKVLSNQKPPVGDTLNFNMSCVSLLCLRPCQSDEIAQSRSVVCEDAPLCFHMQIFNKTSMHLCFLSFLSLGSFMSLAIFYQFSALWFWCLFFINLPAWNLPRTAPTPPWQDQSSAAADKVKVRGEKLQILWEKCAKQSYAALGRGSLLWFSYLCLQVLGGLADGEFRSLFPVVFTL